VHELPGGARTLRDARPQGSPTSPGRGTPTGSRSAAPTWARRPSRPTGGLVSVFGDTFAGRDGRAARAGGRPVVLFAAPGGDRRRACGGRARQGRASPRARWCATATTACAGGDGGSAGSRRCCPPI
jgi:hypothetical protein